MLRFLIRVGVWSDRMFPLPAMLTIMVVAILVLVLGMARCGS